MIYNLWQWLPNQDRWEWVTACDDDTLRGTILRNHRRRNPGGTRFKWRTEAEGAPTRRFRQRRKKD
jgi:hypothetical protein